MYSDVMSNYDISPYNTVETIGFKVFSDDLSNQNGVLLVKVKTSNGKSGFVKIIK